MANWVKSFLLQNPDLAARTVVKRARHALHIRQTDGSILGLFTGMPMHYQDAGQWKPIDTALIRKTATTWGAPGVPITIDDDGVVSIDNSTYSQKTSRVGLYRPSTKQFISTLDLPRGALNGDEFVASGTTWERHLRLTEHGIREELILLERPNIPAQAGDYLVLETQMLGVDLPDGLLAEFAAANHYFPLPVAHDANRKRISCVRRIKRVGGVYYLYTGIPVSALADAVYPVMIDPDFSASTAGGMVVGYNPTYATARSTSYTHDTTSANFHVGQNCESDTNYYIRRAALKFVTSSIGSASNITQVNLKLTPTWDQSAVDFDVQIVKQDWSAQDPIASGNREAFYDNCLAGTADDNIWRNTSGISANTQYTSGNLNTAWPSKTGNTYYSLRSSRDYAGTSPDSTPDGVREFVWFADQEHATAGYRPVLAIAYYLPITPSPVTIPIVIPAPALSSVLTLTPSPVAIPIVVPAPVLALDPYVFLVDWNNDGDFADADENITPYVMQATIQRGRNDDLGQMQAGTCELVLRNASPDGSNPDDDYRFTPRNTGSPLYPIKTGIKCQIVMNIGTTPYYLFTGYLDRPTVDHEARTATLYFVEDFKRWGQMPISTALLESQRAPDVLAAILAAVGYTGSVVADAGADVIPYAGWFDTPAMDCIRELEECEQGVVWIDGQGRVHFEDRHHRLKSPHTTAIATFTNTLEQGPFEIKVDEVLNAVSVSANPMEPAAESELWTMGHKFPLAAGESQTIKAPFGGLSIEVVQPSAAAGTLAGNDAPNSSGTDRSSSLEITSWNVYASGAEFTLKNNYSNNIYVTAMVIRGKQLSASRRMERSAEDTTSQAQYGKRGKSVSSSLLANPNVAQAIADWLVTKEADPPDGIQLVFTANKSDELLLQAASREISDRIHVEEAPYFIDGDFFIEGIRHEISPHGLPHRVTFTLSQAPTGDASADDLFIIGTSLFSDNKKMSF